MSPLMCRFYSDVVITIAAWIMATTFWLQVLLYPSKFFSHKVMLGIMVYSSLTTTIGTIYILPTVKERNYSVLLLVVMLLFV